MNSPRAQLSIVIPLYNEAEVLPHLHERLVRVLSSLELTFEVILVNDGSRDETARLADNIVEEDGRFTCLHFSRNFGHQAAITAGINHASGDAVIIMDADLQDPPELLSQLIVKWRSGFDVVYAQRRSRARETWFKRASAHVFYRLLRRLADVEIPPDTGDFCLMDRRVVAHLNALPERSRYMRGLRAWLGFRQTSVPFHRPPRAAGEPKYNFVKSLGLALNGLVSFSRVPLRLATYMGFVVSTVSFALASYFVYQRLTGVAVPRGWASTIVVVLFLGGVQLLAVGLIGEYLNRIYEEVKQRPTYIVGRVKGQASTPSFSGLPARQTVD